MRDVDRFDIIEFGHYDAYNNALAILALEAAADMQACRIAVLC